MPHTSADRTDELQVDAIVNSVNKMGFFGSVGPLPLFVSSKVGLPWKVVILIVPRPLKRYAPPQFIPSEIKFDANATPPQYTDGADQVIEKDTHIRVKLMGIRSDVGSLFAVGSVKEVSNANLLDMVIRIADLTCVMLGLPRVRRTAIDPFVSFCLPLACG